MDEILPIRLKTPNKQSIIASSQIFNIFFIMALFLNSDIIVNFTETNNVASLTHYKYQYAY